MHAAAQRLHDARSTFDAPYPGAFSFWAPVGGARVLKARLEPIGGAGSRVSFGSGTSYAGTRDAFAQVGKSLVGPWGAIDARAGQATRCGWSRLLNLTLASPGATGLRLELARQSRDSWTPFALGNGAWLRAGGLQQNSGALLTSVFTAQVFRLAFPFSRELEHTSTYREKGLLAPRPGRPAPHRTLAGNRRGDVLLGRGRWRPFAGHLLHGDAIRRHDGLFGPMAPGASHALQRAYTARYGVNFDRLLPFSPLRLRLQLLVRGINNVELTRRGPDRTNAKLERTARRERRVTLAAQLPTSCLTPSFATDLFWRVCPSLLVNLLPQFWYTEVHERRLESQVTFVGPLTRNASWRHLVGDPRAGGAGAQVAQEVGDQRADDVLAREYARLSQGIGERTDALVEGIALEERRERRWKAGGALHFLPLRQVNISPFYEVAEVSGSRTSLRDPHTAEQVWNERNEAFAHSHETFRNTVCQSNGKIRRAYDTEARALWEGEAHSALQQLTLRTTWTLNAKSEALTELDPQEVRDAVDCINDLFGAALRPPGQQSVRGERKIRASYALRPQDLQALRQRMRQKVVDWPRGANLVASESLHALRSALGGAADDASAFEAVADFLAQAKLGQAAKDESSETAAAPAPVLAMALLRALLPTLPPVKAELESNHRPPQLERARAVLVRYAGRPLLAEEKALGLHDRAARVLAATGELDTLRATLLQDASLQGETQRQLFLTLASHRRQLCQLLQLPAERGMAAQRQLDARLLSSAWSEAERRRLSQLLAASPQPAPAKRRFG